ncbi:LIM domain and actin-binding protein 1-like [Astyanax mexicanus]|uniref:LIM domain and actin binding 1 n=1 Tax=Astyanax mexicanus TaxID=7994 RepID=A0A8B9LDA9_ASTMX|nr:LIM domain and actin-binding protein 1-like [Astyanax mexicanus]
METGPFSRKQWASQSLRITARELSLVGGRGKNNAIAERFSKYQKAAEEASDKKKTPIESVPPTLRSGNLSVLKKRWEHDKAAPQLSVAPASAASRPEPPAESRPPARTGAFVRQGSLRQPLTRWQRPVQIKEEKEAAEMEKKQEKKQEMSVEVEQEEAGPVSPTTPCSPLEKPSVPLNSLKKMFEKGEGRVRQNSTEEMDIRPADRGLVTLERTKSLRDRMAKYQLAVSKQETRTPPSSQSNQSESEGSPSTTDHKENVPPSVRRQAVNSISPESTSTKTNGVLGDAASPSTDVSSPENSDTPKLARGQKFRFTVRESCVGCLKTVYPLEKLVANQQTYHNTCFRCAHCSTKLSLANYASLHGTIYCKPHFNQLFKSKGNYDEGFGHRPHKELWTPRADEDETEESEKPEKPKFVMPEPTPVKSNPERTPISNQNSIVEESPLAKVTDIAASLETKTQLSSPVEQPSPASVETKRLRIAWPPPLDGESNPKGTPSSSIESGRGGSVRSFRSKWPPEGEGQSSMESSERVELKNLRRSSSLKERSRPFSVAPRLESTSSPQQEPRRPLRSPMVRRGSLEELRSSPKVHTIQNELVKEKENAEEIKETSKASINKVHDSRKAVNGDTSSEEEIPEERPKITEEKEKVSVPHSILKRPQPAKVESLDDGKDGEEESDRGPELFLHPSPSPAVENKANRTSQDVGFWEGEDAEDSLTVEEMIKRNRCYDDEEDDEEEVAEV